MGPKGGGGESNKESLSRRMDECWWKARGGSEDTLSAPTLSQEKGSERHVRPSDVGVRHRRARRRSGATVSAAGKRDEMPALVELTF